MLTKCAWESLVFLEKFHEESAQRNESNSSHGLAKADLVHVERRPGHHQIIHGLVDANELVLLRRQLLRAGCFACKKFLAFFRPRVVAILWVVEQIEVGKHFFRDPQVGEGLLRCDALEGLGSRLPFRTVGVNANLLGE